jgi:hypothetical protein
VASYKNSGALHWLDARGLIDADHRTPEAIAELRTKNVHVLPVAEVESLLLLPDVFAALALALALDPAERGEKLLQKVLQVAEQQVERVSARYTSRQLDDRLKRLAHDAKDLATLETKYESDLASIDLAAMFGEFRAIFEKAIADRNLERVLSLFDNKTLISLAASVLGLKDNAQQLMERVGRLLGDKDKGANLRAALTSRLPAISVTVPAQAHSGAPEANTSAVATPQL